MKHFLVSWRNKNEEYRDVIVCAEHAAYARALVRAAYKHARQVKARELQV